MVGWVISRGTLLQNNITLKKITVKPDTCDEKQIVDNIKYSQIKLYLAMQNSIVIWSLFSMKFHKPESFMHTKVLVLEYSYSLTDPCSIKTCYQ